MRILIVCQRHYYEAVSKLHTRHKLSSPETWDSYRHCRRVSNLKLNFYTLWFSQTFQYLVTSPDSSVQISATSCHPLTACTYIGLSASLKIPPYTLYWSKYGRKIALYYTYIDFSNFALSVTFLMDAVHGTRLWVNIESMYGR